MRDPSDIIRIWLYNTLNGAITYRSATVPVYAFAPKNAAKPFILIASQSMSSELDESTKNSYITKHSVTLEVYDAYTGNDGSFRGINSITNDMLALVRTRSEIPMTGYDVISCVVDSTLTNSIDNGVEIVFFKIVNITLTVEDLKPEAPVMTASTINIGTSFYINWGKVDTADNYYFDLSTESDFSSFVGGYENKEAGNVLTYQVTELIPNGQTYYARVRASRSSTQSDSSNTITTVTGFIDWFLPSKDELQLMGDNLTLYGSQLTGQKYWSSTEVSNSQAYAYDPIGSGMSTETKANAAINIRAFRSFGDGDNNYSVGDTGPAGGLIFYKDGSTAYEAAPSDISGTSVWSNLTTTLVGTFEGIGTGQSNTEEIIAINGHTTSAAKLCNDLIINI